MTRLALTTVCSVVVLGSITWAWRADIPDTGIARALVVDTTGDVIAGGRTENSEDFMVAKFDGATGVPLWRYTLDGALHETDEALAVASDAAGNVFAAGVTRNVPGGDPESFTVVKLEGVTGRELWRQVIDGDSGTFGLTRATALAVDVFGNVVAVGSRTNRGSDGDFAVIKFDGQSGFELWRQEIDGEALHAIGDSAVAVAVDRTGDVIAGGSMDNGDGLGDLTVLKLDATTGTELWRHVINGGGNGFDTANAIALDADGNVAVAGEVSTVGGFVEDFFVLKLDGVSGTELWHQLMSPGWARTVAVDRAGSVFAAGLMATMIPERPFGFALVKFDGAHGTEQWRHVFSGDREGLDDEANAIALDQSGNVVAAGRVDFNLAVGKFDGKTGEELWRRIVTGTRPLSSVDEAVAVSVDEAGDVVAFGNTDNDVTFFDATILKLNGLDGGDFLPSLKIRIDIRPHGKANRINPRGRGALPVAVFTSSRFDATTIDPTTIRFGATGTEAAPTGFELTDVNRDGKLDALIRFVSRETGIQCGATSASLTATTFHQRRIKGTDRIKTIRC